MQNITPCLWFDNNAEEAANFYITLFPNSKITEITRYNDAASKAGDMPAGTVMTVTFEMNGLEYVALNGGPVFKFSEAVSFMIKCDSQEEVDRLWNKLLENGGEESQCGWLKDRFGFSWQVIPVKLYELLKTPDKAKSEAVTAALMDMVKIELPVLQQAYDSA